MGMGHWCRLCQRSLPHEKFSGKGHRQHVCKACARLPQEEREGKKQQEEIFGYLRQSNMSKKNLSRLRTLCGSSNAEIAELATIVLDVGRIHPQKRRRLKFLARHHRELLKRLEDTGLILAHHL